MSADLVILRPAGGIADPHEAAIDPDRSSGFEQAIGKIAVVNVPGDDHKVDLLSDRQLNEILQCLSSRTSNLFDRRAFSRSTALEAKQPVASRPGSCLRLRGLVVHGVANHPNSRASASLSSSAAGSSTSTLGLAALSAACRFRSLRGGFTSPFSSATAFMIRSIRLLF